MSNYELISTKEAAERLGVSRQRVDQLIAIGAIEAIKIPIPGSKRHHVHIDAASVEARRREARAGRLQSGRRAAMPTAPKPVAAEPIVVADPPKRRRRRRMRQSPHGFLTVAQAAKRLEVAPSTIRRYVEQGLLKGFHWTDESGRQTGRATIMVLREADVDTFEKPVRSYEHLKRAARPAPKPAPKVTPVKAEAAPEAPRPGFWSRLFGRS